MKRINSCAPAGHNTHNAAAALPSTVIGATAAAAARLATTATRLTRPEIPATNGAVTTCAAQATASASASGLGQPRPAKRRDQTGAITTSAAVASTDSAKPTSTASCGATASSTSTEAHNAGIACRRRDDTIPASAMAAITAARKTLAVGCTTMTNASKRHRGKQHGHARADQPGREQHGPAHDRDVGPRHRRQVRHARRAKLAAGLGGDRRGIPENQGGQHRGLFAGQYLPDSGANRLRTVWAARCTAPARPIVGRPVTLSTATVRSLRVGRPMRAVNRTGWPDRVGACLRAVFGAEVRHPPENELPGRTSRRHAGVAMSRETSAGPGPATPRSRSG